MMFEAQKILLMANLSFHFDVSLVLTSEVSMQGCLLEVSCESTTE